MEKNCENVPPIDLSVQDRAFLQEWYEIYFPPFLCTKSPQFCWEIDPERKKEGVWVDRMSAKAIELIFGFTSEELEIYNELGNTDGLWPPEKADQKSAIQLVYGRGGREGIKAEYILLLVHYIFRKYDRAYGEAYEHPERIERLIKEYRKRIYSKFPSPTLWVIWLFRLKTKSPKEWLINSIVEDVDLNSRWR